MDAASTRSVPVGQIRPLGEHALLIGVADALAARTLVRTITASETAGLREVVGGLATVMVAFDPDTADIDVLEPRLIELMSASIDGGSVPPDEGALMVVPCIFDGEDMAGVAEAAGCGPEDVVDMLTARPLTVDVVGFSPGFAYLSGLPDRLRTIARRDRPRPSVRPGSVALANGHAAVYPTASPGGWQLVGRTDETFFNPDVPPYARLAPGDRVQFTVAPEPWPRLFTVRMRSASVTMQPGDGDTPPRAAARPVFVVEEPGVRTVLQDGGRRGRAAIGVPAAGPGDPDSFELANRLVGNPADACVLEVTARGPTLHCMDPTFVAVVGAIPNVRLDGQPVAPRRVVPVNAGQQLALGQVYGGLRTYLAAAGGFAGPKVLGSCATDQLSGLGPGPIGIGAQLWVGAMRPPLGDHLVAGIGAALPAGVAVALRVVPGPHTERFAPGAFASLATASFTVESESNRVGLLLQPGGDPPWAPLAGGVTAELDSQGTVVGAVQIPPNGHPVILLPDHATLGGYPVLAVVAAADHGLLGQCAPGMRVVLVPIDHGEARDAQRARRRDMETAVVGRYPLAVD